MDKKRIIMYSIISFIVIGIVIFLIILNGKSESEGRDQPIIPSDVPAAQDKTTIFVESDRVNEKIYIDSINKGRVEGKITMFRSDYDERTEATADGSDIYEVSVADKTVVKTSLNDPRGSYIPENGYVLSASGSGAGRFLLEQLEVGDSLTLSGAILPPFLENDIQIRDLTIPITSVNSAVRTTAEAVLYSKDFFNEETGTNPYGVELTIMNGRITLVKDYDPINLIPNSSLIPEDGYVLSMHIDNPNFEALQAIAHEVMDKGEEVKMMLGNVPMYKAGKTFYDSFNNPSRGADQLIVYDDTYASSTTGTNPYGFEVTVDEHGIVIAAGSNNSVIPKNGFVISAHGNKVDFLEQDLRVGAQVKIDQQKKQIVATYTPESYIFRGQHQLNMSEQALRTAQEQYRDINVLAVREKLDEAAALLSEAKDLAEQEQFKALVEKLEASEKASKAAYYRSFETRKVENRSVWHRPVEKTRKQVIQVLDDLQSMNANILYVEIDYGGYFVFPTNNGIVKQNPIFEGFDVLQAYVEEGKMRGIEIHAWGKTLAVGPPREISIGADQEIVDDSQYANTWEMYKKGWLMKSRQDKALFRDDAGIHFYFLSPAHPEAMNWLTGIYKEIAEIYDLDGIQVDYVRYPTEDPHYPGEDPGYEQISRNKFKELKGVDPIELQSNDPLFAEWNEFRVDLINKIVFDLVTAIKSVDKELEVSAAVWPIYHRAKAELYQDAIRWVEDGYIDNMAIMTYNPGMELVTHDTVEAFKFAIGKSAVTTGLGAYIELPIEMLVEQVAAVRESADSNGNIFPTNGIGIFEYQSLFRTGYDAALKEGVFSEGALTTSKDPSKAIEIIMTDMTRKINDIYVISPNGLSSQQAAALIEELKNIKENASSNVKVTEAVVKGIESLLEKINRDSSINEHIIMRMLHDLKQARDVALLAIKKQSQ